MPEIIDILTPDIDECPYFVASNLVDYVVPSIPVAPPAAYIFKNSQTRHIVQKGDNFRFISCGFICQESFTIFKRATVESLPLFGVLIRGSPSTDIYFNPSFSGSEFFLPMENYELVLDVFCNCADTYKGGAPANNLQKENFYFTYYSGGIDVSMMNVPAAFSGKTFYIVPFIKLLHNIEMV
jgi:hypothetical protein